MIDYNIKTMTNVIKYENFTEWKKEKTYKAKSLTCDICIKYISNVYVDYVINYSFNNFS